MSRTKRVRSAAKIRSWTSKKNIYKPCSTSIPYAMISFFQHFSGIFAPVWFFSLWALSFGNSVRNRQKIFQKSQKTANPPPFFKEIWHLWETHSNIFCFSTPSGHPFISFIFCRSRLQRGWFDFPSIFQFFAWSGHHRLIIQHRSICKEKKWWKIKSGIFMSLCYHQRKIENSYGRTTQWYTMNKVHQHRVLHILSWSQKSETFPKTLPAIRALKGIKNKLNSIMPFIAYSTSFFFFYNLCAF